MTSRLGSTSCVSANAKSAVAIAASTIARTTRLEARVVYVLFRTARWAITSFTASPPRIGRIALTPTPAMYAAQICRQRTRSPGYAAAMVFRQARLVQSVFRRWQQMASASGAKSTAPRRSKKTSIASKTRSMSPTVAPGC
jgi:hypothetical protein